MGEKVLINKLSLRLNFPGTGHLFLKPSHEPQGFPDVFASQLKTLV